MLPATSLAEYITGMPALSVPNKDGFVADWHFDEAFSGKKPLPLAGVNIPSTNHLLGSQGVENRGDYLRGAGVRADGAIYVASAPRAIADLLFRSISQNRDLSWLSLDQYCLPSGLADELAHMVQILDGSLHSEVLRAWHENQQTAA